MNRGNFLKEIIETARSSLDINEIKKNIVVKVGEFFQADRCFIRMFDYEQDSFLPVDKHSEYLSSSKIESIVSIEPESATHDPIKKVLKSGKNSFIPKVEEGPLKEKYSLKSTYALPVIYSKELIGAIVLNYTESVKHLNTDDIQLLENIADQISINLYHAGLYEKSKKIAEREKLLRAIIEKVRGTLNSHEIKRTFVSETGKYFNANRVIITEYDKSKDFFEPVDEYSEYICPKTLPSMVKMPIEQPGFEHFMDIYRKKQTLVISEVDEYLRENNLTGTKTEKILTEINFKSGMGVTIVYGKEILGLLTIHLDRKVNFSKEDVDFFESITNQLGIALHQAELYEKERQTAERERLLREIIEAIRSSLNIDEVLSKVCNEIGKTYKVQRATLTEIAFELDKFKWTIKGEYKQTENIKSISTIKNVDQITSFLNDAIVSKDKILAIGNVPKSNMPDFIKETYTSLGIKSVLGIPIKRGADKWGFIFLSEYDYYRCWTEDEIKLLENIADNVYLAINQANLYNKEKQTAEREFSIRNIVDAVRSTINKGELKQLLVKTIGKFFQADRVLFSEFDPISNMYFPVDKYSEYLSSSKEKSFINYDWSNPSIREYIQPLIEKKELNIHNWSEYLKRNPKSQAFIDLFEDADVISSYNIPVLYRNEIKGYFCIEFTKREYKFSEEELDFVRCICNQTAISLTQAELYEKEKQTAERERLLREIIETIRNSLDINEIKQSIVSEVGKAFNADRCYFRSFNKKLKKFHPPDVEYLGSPDTISLLDFPVNQEGLSFFFMEAERKKSHSPLIINQELIQKECMQNSALIEYFEEAGIKTDVAIPIWDKEEELSFLVLHFVENISSFSEEEINLMEALAKQTVMAINHSKLYEALKRNNEREMFFSSIISVIKSAPDIHEILPLVHKKTQKFYKNTEKMEQEDISLLERIDNNVSIAIRDSDLYNKSRFIADVSHELRTPVAIIDGYANNLLNKQDYSPETVDKYLEIIKKNTDRMTHIIENIMTLSKLEKGQEGSTFTLQEIEVEKVIKNVLQTLETLAQDKKIDFEARYSPSLKIKANGILIEQALLNLVKNGLRYSNSKSKIIINAEKAAKKAIISVQDFGCGIEKHELKNIFKRFYRVDKSRSRITGGSGLGLSIVERIVELHNGKIDVRSKLNEGSTFTIEIPCF